MKTRYQKTVLAGAVALMMCAGLSPPAFAQEEILWTTDSHIFSTNDVQGGFDGSTVGDTGLISRPEILCKTMPCGDAEIIPADESTDLYPIDSQFGYYVEDFVGAAPKQYDADYLEGHVGDIGGTPGQEGVLVSNAATDKFKVKYPMGTWCAGLGANSVKCSTEHYTVLEHIMTCNETVPYFYANADGTQAFLLDPATGEKIADGNGGYLTCATGALHDDLMVVENGALTNLLKPDPDNIGAPDMDANESTVLDLIATGPDYAMTKKDDGKPLYRFGNFIKKPNDIRLYAKLALPDEWKVDGADYTVTSAKLIIEHLVTNNPNDQIRPEDMENEGATGRKPGYTVVGSGDTEKWQSDRFCYEGDGDFIDVDTDFRLAAYGREPDNSQPPYEDATPPSDGLPYPFSADLVGGYTNAWYTTTDRDPFDNVEVGGVADIENGGPRWRLIANKFGQDIPGLEIPKDDCSPVPYTSSNIRYPVGAPITTTINLLDWAPSDEIPVSPLLSSKGWVDASLNKQNYTKDPTGDDPAAFVNTGPNGVSINGAPLTDDFDLLIYVKGDRKATALYTATLELTYTGEAPPPPPENDLDLELVSVTAPATAAVGDPINITYTVRNNGALDAAGGTLTVVGQDTGPGLSWVESILGWAEVAIPTLSTGEEWSINVPWTVWTKTAPVVDVRWGGVVQFGGDEVPANNNNWDTYITITD